MYWPCLRDGNNDKGPVKSSVSCIIEQRASPEYGGCSHSTGARRTLVERP